MRPSIDATFPESASEFYRLRDDRTNQYVKNPEYSLATCVVSIDSTSIQSLAGQTMLAVACNLLSRWCRHVEVVLPRVDFGVAFGRCQGLKETIIASMLDADPFGSFSLSSVSDVPSGLRLHIGAHPDFEGFSATYINASGWIASIGASPMPTLLIADDSNIVGPVAAACLGVAQIFKRALGTPKKNLIADGTFNLFTMQRTVLRELRDTGPIVSGVQPGKILLVGAGSVGSSLAYCLRLGCTTCELAIVDKDYVLIENLNRSPLFGKANFGKNKADAIAIALQDTSIRSTAYPMSWNRFIEVHGRAESEFDIWLPLANEDNVRMSVQQNVPPLLIYAATSPNWGASYGRWIPGQGDCLIERYPVAVNDGSLGCSEAQVEVAGSKVDAALPFLSLFAGLLVFADLIRLQFRTYPQVSNFVAFDFGGTLEEIQTLQIDPRPECSCKKLSPGLYKSFNRYSRYFGLAFR
jgi:hypothetical protein